MPKIRKRVNDGESDTRQPRPKKTKDTQVDTLAHPLDEAHDSGNDHGHVESQEFLALTRKRVKATSDGVLTNFDDVLEARKKTSMGSLSNYATAIEAKEDELRKSIVAILAGEFPNDPPTYGMENTGGNSAVVLQSSLKNMSESNTWKPKTLLKQYRSLSQTTAAPRENISIGSSSTASVESLKLLLDRHRQRLRVEIHAILDDEDPDGNPQVENKGEEELWSRFGAVSNIVKAAKHDEGRQSGSWTESTKNSTRALRRLVKILPEEE